METARVYFAHPMWIYDTKEEEEALKVIKGFFDEGVEIVNPREHDRDPKLKERKRREGMAFCFKLIDGVDCLVFQRFMLSRDFRDFVLDRLAHADGYKSDLSPEAERILREVHRLAACKNRLLTPGVYKEVNYAIEKGKPVFEVTGRRLKRRSRRVRPDIQGPGSLYKAFSRLIKVYRGQSRDFVSFPPFWWLE